MGCSRAVYSVKAVVDFYTNQGTTVNLCALDLKKAFHKMNHFGLYIKLMGRMIPNCLLSLIEHWFNICVTCVWFGGYLSSFFFSSNAGLDKAEFSPLFLCCVHRWLNQETSAFELWLFRPISVCKCFSDIILLAPYIDALTKILRIVENELASLDMALNASKSVCIRYGPRFDRSCSEINSGEGLRWVSTCRYLGVFLVALRKFKISLDNNKRSFYRSFNAIFGNIGRLASMRKWLYTWPLWNVYQSTLMVWTLARFVLVIYVLLTLLLLECSWKFFRSARLMLSKTVKLCLIFAECQSWSWIENVNFCKNSVRATILHVKLLHLWRRISCQAYVQLVKVC